MEPRQVAYCPHCGNDSPQLLVYQGTSLNQGNAAHHFILTHCLTCAGHLLYRQVTPGRTVPLGYKSAMGLENYQLVWPEPADLHHSVPNKVRRCYAEAAAIKCRAPNAFANQIRRSLEAVCRDREAGGRSLADNLRYLADQGELPETLVEMTTIIRMLGNLGSHAAEEDVGPDHVEAIDDFFRAVVEYVYVAPFRVNEVRAQLDRASLGRPQG